MVGFAPLRRRNVDLSFLQPLAYLVALYGFVWSMRKDSKEDYLKMEKLSRENHLMLEKKLETWRDETNKKIDAIAQEMKDFHGRLCAIEERRRIEILK